MVGLPAGQGVRVVVRRPTQECGSGVTRCWVMRHPEGVVRPPIRECGETPTEPGKMLGGETPKEAGGRGEPPGPSQAMEEGSWVVRTLAGQVSYPTLCRGYTSSDPRCAWVPHKLAQPHSMQRVYQQ